MDAYLNRWLRGDAGPGAPHGEDDPHNGLDGRPPPGGWQNLPAYDDANSEASAAAHGTPDSSAPAATPGAMPFDSAARAGNLYSGGFIPLINYGYANQGNPAAKGGADPNPYAGYGAGGRRLDTGLATLYGTPDPTGAGRQPAAAATAAPTSTTQVAPPGSVAGSGGGGAGGGERSSGAGAQGGHDPRLDIDLHRYLYGV